MIFLKNINRCVKPSDVAIDEGDAVRSPIVNFRRLLFVLCWWIAAVTVVLQARPAWAEVFYGINDTGIYSVDTVAGGPATTLVAAPPLPGGTANSYVTLAVRPSDGLLFFLDTQGANPTLRRQASITCTSRSMSL